jgi:predicted nuclease of restriction endonuclease-like (RecB) superfamily
MRIENESERNFYEIETIGNKWSVRELSRQINSLLYERLQQGKNTIGIRKLSNRGQIIEKPLDLIKDPYVLEFLDLADNAHFNETDFESALIDKLEHFMLELGKGFTFVGRQVRFTFEEEHFRIDLVFYHRLLKCFVLIDLKIGKLKHQDLGQMQMYVNFFDREIKLEDVFNDEKREGAKRVIHQHKVLKSLSLVNPAHLEMTSNGHGEFPDGYKLTHKGILYIIEQLNKE